MKTTTLLLAAAWMLLLWFVPQSAKAELDVAGNLTKPFTIETTTTSSGGKIEFRCGVAISGNTATTIDLEYRKEVNGVWDANWTTVSISGTTTYAQLYANSITLSANTTYKIQFRGVNSSGFSKSDADYYRIVLGSSSTAWNVTMYGNIMSLIVGYDDSDEPTAQAALEEIDNIPSAYCFYALFDTYVATGTASTGTPSTTMYPPIINAENLIFPAKYLKNYCYARAFLFYKYGR